MQLHEVNPKHKLKKKKRIGRGGKKGGYSGKGIKGQKSRAGRKLQPIVRELTKRYPKLKGHRFELTGHSLSRIKLDKDGKEIKELRSGKLAIVNLDALEKHFKPDEKVTPETLVQKKLVRKIRGKVPRVKILAKGDIKKALIVENCEFSKQVKEKIEKVGGKV